MSELEKIRILPLLPLKNSVLFPGLLMPLSVGRSSSLAAVEAAVATEDKEIIVVAQRDADQQGPDRADEAAHAGHDSHFGRLSSDLASERASRQPTRSGEAELVLGAGKLGAQLGVFGNEDGEDRRHKSNDTDSSGEPGVESSPVQDRG